MTRWQAYLIRLAGRPALREWVARLPTMRRLRARHLAGPTAETAAAAAARASDRGLGAMPWHVGAADPTPEGAARELAEVARMAEALQDAGLPLALLLDVRALGAGLSEDAARRLAVGFADHFRRLVGETPAASFAAEGDAADAGLRRSLVMLEAGDPDHFDDLMRLRDTLARLGVPAGATVHACYRRSDADIRALIAARAPVRLAAGRPPRGWLQAEHEPRAIRRRYIRLARHLLSEEAHVNRAYPAFVIDHPRLARAVDHVLQHAGWNNPYELEFALGRYPDLQRALSRRGRPLRLLLPYGQAWWLYLSRLAE
jgi:proline dehydrogenase